MSTEVAAASAGGPTRSRPNTRSTIRQSLNFSSMGKALADVMHKESKGKEEKEEKEKTKRSKETSSRRSSVVPAPRMATEKTTSAKTKTTSPESKTITRGSRRLSALPKASGTTSSEEQSSPVTTSPPEKRGGSVRVSTLRPRNSLANSALPKYRPKSALVEAAKSPPSPPARAGTRRRLSDSDDEKEEKGKLLLSLDPPKDTKKNTRAISPLPHRNALQVNLTAAINVQPATPEKKTKSTPNTPRSAPPRQDSPTRLSPTRARSIKSTATTSSPASKASSARPPSSASSSSSSRAPQSPSTPTMANRVAGGSNRLKSSPLRGGQSESPLAGMSARRMQPRNESPSPTRSKGKQKLPTPLPPVILTADSSIDSLEASDVEFMLSSIASPGAPTPAIPRFRTNALRSGRNPQTPPRLSPFTLPGRANMSYISPGPPGSDNSPFLRPRGVGNDRGSILSWEQLAQHNRSMGVDDVDHMLADVDAPFPASPALSHLPDIPESPSLSAMPSPTGYGSISQVLLPEVTPSPAPHVSMLRYEDGTNPPSPIESAAVTLLRLQIASFENTNKEQAARIQALEYQLVTAREARLQDVEDLSRQVSALEEQIVQSSLAADDRAAQRVASLEEQLAHVQAAQNEAIEQVAEQARQDALAAQTAALQKQRAVWELASVACDARAAWRDVRNTAEGELELVRSSRETLVTLLAGLDNTLLNL